MHVRYDEHLDAVYIILRYLKAAPEKIYYLERKKTSFENVAIFTYAD